jgi:hypothetical protein
MPFARRQMLLEELDNLDRGLMGDDGLPTPPSKPPLVEWEGLFDHLDDDGRLGAEGVLTSGPTCLPPETLGPPERFEAPPVTFLLLMATVGAMCAVLVFHRQVALLF